MSDKVVIRLPLDAAIASILGKRDHSGYRNIGHNMSVKSLYTTLGLTGSPMIYKYLSGGTKNIEPERALAILREFGVLIDTWLTEEELLASCTNKELSIQIASRPIQEVIEKVIEAEKLQGEGAIKKALRKIIAKYY